DRGGADRDHDGGDGHAVEVAGDDRGRHDRRGGGGGHGGRALGDAHRHGDQVCRHDQRQAHRVEALRDLAADAGLGEDRAEGAARTGDQDDRADGRERVVHQLLEDTADLLAATAPRDHVQQQHRQEGGERERDRGGTDQPRELEPDVLVRDGALGLQGGEGGVEEDQHQRQQQHQDDAGEAGPLLDRDVAGLAEQGRHRGVREPLRDRTGHQVAAEVPGGQADEQADEHDHADVGPHHRRGRGGAGMRRQQRVHHHERRDRGQHVQHERAAQPARDGVDDRQHHDEAGVEEDREGVEQRGDGERQRCPRLPERVEHLVGEHLGSAGHLDQPAQHRAESDQQRHGADRRAEAVDDHVYDVADADAGGEPGGDGDDQEREEGVQARLDDEDEQDDDRDDRDRQEQPDRPIREDEFFHGGLQVVGAG